MPSARRPPASALVASSRPPRTKPAEVRLDELMAAAEQLFIAKGIEATTVNDIVETAGVAKGTFYHYFASKHEMLQALRAKFSQGFLAQVDAAVQACPRGDGPARIYAWTQAGVAAYLANYRLHDVVFHDARHGDRGAREKTEVLNQLEQVLADGAQGGHWTLAAPRLTAIVLFHGMHGAVDDAIARGEHDGAALAGPLSDIFLQLLGVARA
ncbi:TetR/AcrR family transcriptional regulator [Bordetella sp. BOR01]|uniref:TetR/AcrR family transcriptional regulator n=1 Tax=Bordetella sp. BOR01 TaxID=2854779 RepID=UPI001C495081|nr:TetR/AcrR family transcriptional regulator [Bordetella sp. BOR01]MBV7486810.1 TetR/AcrR family transcriptional regulator [Bordetella sp. BOR01]